MMSVPPMSSLLARVCLAVLVVQHSTQRHLSKTRSQEQPLITLPPISTLLAATGLIIGDFNRDGVAGENETTLTLSLEEAMDIMSPGGG